MGEDPSNAAHTELFRHSLKHGAGVGGMSVSGGSLKQLRRDMGRRLCLAVPGGA